MGERTYQRFSKEFILEAIRIAAGETEAAVIELMNLRQRLDGCGATPNMNDWILDCAAQLAVRDLLDALIENLAP